MRKPFIPGFYKRRPSLELFGLNSLELSRYRRERLNLRQKNEAAIRALCSAVYLGGDTALCRVLGRYKMYVDVNDRSVSAHLMLDGYWEMWITEVLAEIVKPGMVAVDVGANLGYFTLLMADLVGAEGAVHAFEPNSSIADRLAKSVEVSGFGGRVEVHRAPLGAVDGAEVFLTVPPGAPSGAHLTSDAAAPGATKLIARRLDSYSELLDADVVKIDAEGAELDIWRGMAGLFERGRKPLTVLLEFAAVRYGDPGAFLSEIEACGFALGDVHMTHGVRERTREQILSEAPNCDQMLILRR